MQATAAPAPAPAELNASPAEQLAAAGHEKNPLISALEQALFHRLHCRAEKERKGAEKRQGIEKRMQEQHGLARYDDLDRRISEASAENIRSNGAVPIPAKLEQEYNERRTARERLGITNAGLAVLERELAQAEQAEKEAEAEVTGLAIDVIVGVDVAAIAEKIAAHKQQWLEFEDQVYGLEFALTELAQPLPADVKVRLAAQLRRLKEALVPPKRPYIAGLHAQYARAVKAVWLERFNELTK